MLLLISNYIGHMEEIWMAPPYSALSILLPENTDLETKEPEETAF